VVPSPKTGLHSLSGPIVDIVLDIIYHIMCWATIFFMHLLLVVIALYTRDI
jgi:hypothetical protein